MSQKSVCARACDGDSQAVRCLVSCLWLVAQRNGRRLRAVTVTQVGWREVADRGCPLRCHSALQCYHRRLQLKNTLCPPISSSKSLAKLAEGSPEHHFFPQGSTALTHLLSRVHPQCPKQSPPLPRFHCQRTLILGTKGKAGP